ncbi:MAG: Maf family protein, partial [Pseudomonadales bacterium]
PCTLGADTMVVQGDKVFGKPRDASDHRRMMLALAGCSHLVYTSVALCTSALLGGAEAGDTFGAEDGDEVVLSCTEVRFKPLLESEIESYWDTGEPCDKAGGYAIQGFGALMVESIAGSYSGVVGLPLCETGQLLRRAGIVTALDR